MHESDRVKLLFGPYRMPKCKVGSILRCSIRGHVRVRSISNAPIMWPSAQRGQLLSLIHCGDLIRAVRQESAVAVAHWWGVTVLTVTKWRNALGVERITKGTSALLTRWAPECVASPDCQAKARTAAKSPERNAKIGAASRGRPRPAHAVEASRRANIGRKITEETRQKMREAARRRDHSHLLGVPWKAEEVVLLGTMTDAAIGKRIGRSEDAVGMRRRQLGISPFVKHKPRSESLSWTPAMDRKLGKASDGDVARKLGCTKAMVLYRRRQLGILAFQP